MLLLIQKLLSVVLAVDIQQGGAQAAELGHSHRPAVDPAGVPAVGVDLPLEEELPLPGVQAALPEDRQLRHGGEHRADKGLCRAGPDQLPAGPLAQYRPHGVDDDGFPGACLAGEGVETGVKGDVSLLDHGDIFNMEQVQHG